MLHVSTQKLIQKLCAMTQAGDVAWQEGAGNSVVFETEGYRIEAESDPPSVRVLRSDGKELEGASAADLEAARWPDEDATYATHVADMVRRARRIARGAEQAISKILSSLSAPPQKAPEPLHQFVALTEPEPPPSPHTLPDPAVRPPHADTAIETVLSTKPPEVENAVSSAMVEARPEPQPAPDPVIDEAIEQRSPLPEPQFRTPPAYIAPLAPQTARVNGGFGATQSFSLMKPEKPQPPAPPPVPPPAPAPVAPTAQAVAPEPARNDLRPGPKLTSSGLFITGFSAVSRQVVREDAPPQRPAPPPPPSVQAPKPAPPAPEPKREVKREPAPAPGADIYKPWS